MKIRLLVLAVAAAASLGWAGVARAGYAVGPPSGSTPTFEVELDPGESLGATVYVATDTQMGS